MGSSVLPFSLDVENAEDELVAKTEQAISLMKAVLENVSHFHAFDLSHMGILRNWQRSSVLP